MLAARIVAMQGRGVSRKGFDALNVTRSIAVVALVNAAVMADDARAAVALDSGADME